MSETLQKLYLELAKTPGVGDAARTHRDIAYEKHIAALEAENEELRCKVAALDARVRFLDGLENND